MTNAALKSRARAIADVGAGTILATVDIAVPPERVYRALTSPEEIVKWWGSDDDYRTTGWTSKLERGGRWRAEGKSKDGTPFFVEGEYLELDPPKKIVCTWRAPWDGSHPTTITYRLEPIDGGTRLTLRHEGFGERVESCKSHAIGWERVLGWMTDYVRAPKELRYFVCRLLTPRPTFVADMTADERAMMVAHAAYWTERQQEGKVVVFGPVADPKGPWGLAVLRVESEDEARALHERDPAITAKGGLSYEILPMLRAIVES